MKKIVLGILMVLATGCTKDKVEEKAIFQNPKLLGLNWQKLILRLKH
jgi:hypothetical protein